MRYKNIPESILEATAHNFDISKNDISDPDNNINRPEIYVNRIIIDWVESISSELERNKNPAAWDRYHVFFGRRICLDNDHFPSTLPIGYVLACFFLSVYPKKYTLDTVYKIFNRWIAHQDTRKKLFDHYRLGKMYVQPVDINVDETPDGVQLSKSLYGPTQQDIFSQEP